MPVSEPDTNISSCTGCVANTKVFFGRRIPLNLDRSSMNEFSILSQIFMRQKSEFSLSILHWTDAIANRPLHDHRTQSQTDFENLAFSLKSKPIYTMSSKIISVCSFSLRSDTFTSVVLRQPWASSIVRSSLALSSRSKVLSLVERHWPTFIFQRLMTPSLLPVNRMSPTPATPYLGENSQNLTQD